MPGREFHVDKACSFFLSYNLFLRKVSDSNRYGAVTRLLGVFKTPALPIRLNLPYTMEPTARFRCFNFAQGYSPPSGPICFQEPGYNFHHFSLNFVINKMFLKRSLLYGSHDGSGSKLSILALQ